jgi:hypothetical protein
MKSYMLSRLAVLIGIVVPTLASAQWVTTHEQFYLEARHNWQFRERYQAADRMFNAFDFGHAILYETLWTKPGAPASELEEKWYDRLTKKILVDPPRVPLEEAAIEIGYVKLAPEAKAMFEWAHILHRQLYDVLADPRLTGAQQDAEVALLVAYYKTRRDLAFSSRPKTMALMQEQPYSLAFRKGYPKFNGLIWAYHWLQVGLYEPLLVNTTTETQQAGVRATVARFWQMLDSVPSRMPHVMPMTAAVAPRFAQRYSEAAIIFDNLHSMHDVISDILANPSVPRDRKRTEILLAATRFRDDTSFVMSVDAWRAMATHMGIENMGGPAVGFLTALPPPTVTYGAVMTHDDRTGAMTGFKYGSAIGGGGAHAQHGGEVTRSDSAKTPADAHAGHATPASGADSTKPPMDDERMMQMHMRMLEDPVIRARMLADTALNRMMMEMLSEMPAEHRAQMERMMDAPAPARRATAAPARSTRPAARTPARTSTKQAPRAATKQPTKQATRQPTKQATKQPTKTTTTKTKAADPHAGHKPPP